MPSSNRKNIRCKEKKAMKLLLYTKKVLDKNEIPFWLDSGTLLGLYRYGRLLPHAKDLTIGVPSQYFHKIMSLKSSFLPWYRLRLKYDKSGYRWIDGDITKLYIIPTIEILLDRGHEGKESKNTVSGNRKRKKKSNGKKIRKNVSIETKDLNPMLPSPPVHKN